MEFLGTQLIDGHGLTLLMTRLLVNLLVLTPIIYVWNRKNGNRIGFSFTLGLFNLITFLICFILRQVPMEIGFALGLFAVFGILRYRTETVPAKAISYLFISIGVAIINALSNDSISWVEIIVANFLIVAGVFVFERKASSHKDVTLILESLDFLSLSREEQLTLIAVKTGSVSAKDFTVEEIDHVRDTIRLIAVIQ